MGIQIKRCPKCGTNEWTPALPPDEKNVCKECGYVLPKKSPKVKGGKAKFNLVISVEYKPNGVPLADLRRLLYDASRHLANEGLLSGETDAEVEEWSAVVVTK